MARRTLNPIPRTPQGLRAALNAALFRTGDQSRDFAVVLATNRPADLDPAVLDRMDEALEFPLPGPAERARILAIYIDSYIAKAGSAEGESCPHACGRCCMRRGPAAVAWSPLCLTCAYAYPAVAKEALRDAGVIWVLAVCYSLGPCRLPCPLSVFYCSLQGTTGGLRFMGMLDGQV